MGEILDRSKFESIIRIISISSDREHLFELFTNEIRGIVSYGWASLAVLRNGGDVAFYQAKGLKEKALPEDHHWPLKYLSPSSVLTSLKEPFVAQDLLESGSSEKGNLAKAGVGSYIIFPLVVQGKLIGTLNLWDSRQVRCEAKEKDFIFDLSKYLAVFLMIHQLSEELNQAKQLNLQKDEEMRALRSSFNLKFSLSLYDSRDLINLMIGYSSVLLQGTYGQLNPGQSSVIRRLMEDSFRLNHLNSAALEFMLLESEPISLKLEDIDLETCIRESIKKFQLLFPLNGIKLLVKIKKGTLISSDCSRFQCVVKNLLYYALKNSGLGSITISTCLIPERIDTILIEITYEGKEPAANISSQAEREDISLVIAKKAVDLLRGRIKISSRAKGGKVISIYLPRTLRQ